MTIPVIAKLVKGFVGNEGIVDSVNVETTAGSNVQSELDQLRGTIAASVREINIFNDGFTVTSANYNTYVGKNNIYGAARDKIVQVRLPQESDVVSYPVLLEFQHFGGTTRNAVVPGTTTRTNQVVIATQNNEELREGSTTGNQISSVTMNQGDVAIFEKTAAGQPWIVVRTVQDTRGSILPEGVFRLNSRMVTVSGTGSGPFNINGLTTYTPVSGDAFEVRAGVIPDDADFPQIDAGDVLVAKINNPSTALNASNDDWLVIRDARNLPLTFQEIRFLSQVSETDGTSDIGFLDVQPLVADALVWASSQILATAPFLTPSADTARNTDPNNPMYLGGREDRNTDNQFVTTSDRLNNYVYIGITPSYINANSTDGIYMIHKTSSGREVERYSLSDDFIFLDDASFTNSTVNHYVYSEDGTNPGQIDYRANDALELWVLNIERHYTVNSATVDFTANINDLQENQLSDAVVAKLNDNHSQAGLSAALASLNNQASVFSITHTDYRSNNSHSYLSSSFALLKNAPTTFPNTAGAFANEINGAAVTVDDPSTVTSIQDVGRATNNVMSGAGINGESFGINWEDGSNWRLIIGGWMYYNSLPSSYQPILKINERYPGSSVDRDIFGMGPNGLTFKTRTATGDTVNTSYSAHLYTDGAGAAGGQTQPEIVAGTLSFSFRAYTAKTYFIRLSGFNGGALQGGEGHNYVVANINTSQAETTQVYDLGAGNQTAKIKYDAASNLYRADEHLITVSVDSIISGLDAIRVEVLDQSITVSTSTNNTYADTALSEGHAAAGRLMRYIVSFRSINGVPTGNLEADVTFFGYDINGNPAIFDENVIEFGYPAIDLDYSDLKYGGSGIHQNVQGFYLNPDTPLIEYPRHSTLRNWLTNYDRKDNQWCWSNVHGPSQDTEAVHFPEFVNFSNFILVAPNRTRYSLSVDNAGTLKTEIVT